MPFPNDLLEQARHLANREPKRPKQASPRRAVSTAYYALFHLLSTETAKNWKRPAERFTVARMLDHAPMARVCTAKRDELNVQFKTRPRPGHDLNVFKHLHAITNTFVNMLQHRHTAITTGRSNGAARTYWRRSNLSKQHSKAGVRSETNTRHRISS